MNNQFLKLLAAYAPTSNNQASYDETLPAYVKKLGLEEISIDNGLLSKLYNTFIDKPRSIILSGSAGDGKTYLLRKLYEKLSNDSHNWDNYIPIIEFQGYTIEFIKEFTGLEDRLTAFQKLYASIYENSKHLLVIAANDGKLTDTLREATPTREDHFLELLTLIEKHIDDPHNVEGNLILLDLSQTSSAKNFELLLNAILEMADRYESNCQSLSDPTIFCPIHSNIALLKKAHIQKQLLTIIRSCDLNYNHITLRKLFMLIANMILGYKGEQRVFSSCEEAIQHYAGLSNSIDASFYNNIFGDNLSRSKQEQSPFKELLELRIGYETTNNIDNFILYGDIQASDLHSKRLSNPFFDFEAFNAVKEKYLEEGDSTEIQKYLRFLRRHLFFNFNEKILWNAVTINLNELMTYEHAEDFYSSVIIPLKNKQGVSKHIIKGLALGLNRIFLGELLGKDGSDRLYIGSSLTSSMSKLSSEVIARIEFNQKHLNQGIHLKLIDGFDEEYCKVDLEIEFSGKRIASLELDLHMYEFLRRIADGILPTSFSAEYYERVLTFKSQIVNCILESQELDNTFNLFELNDAEGTLQFNEIQVENGYVRES
ncbi:MAG: ATP-binding protein [Bacteroidales bacterium]|nr:ATP-binding protein [Bacteroidales bacterium]